MRILVADDDTAVRSALRLLFFEEANLTLVGETVRAEELLDLAGTVQPDLVLLDWELPGLHYSVDRAAGLQDTQHNARRLLTALRTTPSHPKIIALSGRSEMRQQALALGADAFVSKGDHPEQLLATMARIQNQPEQGLISERDGSPANCQ